MQDLDELEDLVERQARQTKQKLPNRSYGYTTDAGSAPRSAGSRLQHDGPVLCDSGLQSDGPVFAGSRLQHDGPSFGSRLQHDGPVASSLQTDGPGLPPPPPGYYSGGSVQAAGAPPRPKARVCSS